MRACHLHAPRVVDRRGASNSKLRRVEPTGSNKSYNTMHGVPEVFDWSTEREWIYHWLYHALHILQAQQNAMPTSHLKEQVHHKCLPCSHPPVHVNPSRGVLGWLRMATAAAVVVIVAPQRVEDRRPQSEMLVTKRNLWSVAFQRRMQLRDSVDAELRSTSRSAV